MLTQNDLVARWRAIPQYNGGYQLVDATHPLHWYVGYSDVGRRTLMLIAGARFKQLQSSRSIEVSQRQRPQDEKWTLSFDLFLSEQSDVFAFFCSDIIEYTRSCSSEAEGVQLIEKRWMQWNLLLEKQRKTLLSASEQLGLIGELYTLIQLIRMGKKPDEAVSAWVGPEGADRDFEFSDVWYEVKTTGAASQTITVSSLEQLDDSIAGHLRIVRADKCSPERSDGVTLDALVEEAKETIGSSLAAASSFDRKLLQIGYLSRAEYASQKYLISNFASYRVDSTFPKILRSSISSEIVSARYDLSIAAIEPWKE